MRRVLTLRSDGSSVRVIKKRDRQSGGHRAVSHFQIRDGGLGDRSALIQLSSFEGGDAQRATVLRDNGASAFALDSYPVGNWYPGVCRDCDILSRFVATRWPRKTNLWHH